MEKIESFKMVREDVIANSIFVSAVVNYIRDFRIEHLFDTVKFKEERISGCPVRYFREDGKRKESYGETFTITLFNDCWDNLFIMFDDGEEHPAIIPVQCGYPSTAIEKLVELIEAKIKKEPESFDNWFPYVKANISINAKVYE